MINTIKKLTNKYYTTFSVLLIVVAIITVIILRKTPEIKTLTIVPNSAEHLDSLFDVGTFADDAEDSGKSFAGPAIISNKSIIYQYVLNDGVEYPYAGLSFYADTTASYRHKLLDISGYDSVTVKADVKNSISEYIYIEPKIKGYSTFENKGSWGSYSAELPVVNGKINQKLSLKNDFSTPNWWCANNNLSQKVVKANADFSEVYEIIIQNGNVTNGDTVQVNLKELKFIDNNSAEVATYNLRLTILAIIIVLIIMMSLTVIRLSSLSSISKEADNEDDSGKIVIPYDKVEIEDEESSDLQRITEYIASHYTETDLSVEKLSKGAGVSTTKIPTILKKQFSMNFKQYLNTVRITEAKRLLLETDHQIVTIAHSVGYNNIPHFNRTFKQVTGISPKQFREHPEEANEY